MFWVLLRALPILVQLHVPSKGQSNCGQVSCSRTQVSQPGLEPTLCCSETLELEFGALNLLAHDTPQEWLMRLVRVQIFGCRVMRKESEKYSKEMANFWEWRFEEEQISQWKIDTIHVPAVGSHFNPPVWQYQLFHHRKKEGKKKHPTSHLTSCLKLTSLSAATNQIWGSTQLF